MEACLKASNEVNAETTATNPDFKKVLASMLQFRNKEYLWFCKKLCGSPTKSAKDYAATLVAVLASTGSSTRFRRRGTYSLG